MNEHDHAVVIGVERYADASADSGWINDLQGPVNDAEAITAWMRSEDGGGLPAENVRVVRSADSPDPFPTGAAAPSQPGLEEALKAVTELPKSSYGGRFSGRRIYVYVSGHGFARHADESALITAEAVLPDEAKTTEPANVLVSSWMEWLYNASRFQEFVLWADCCATRAQFTFVNPCPLPARNNDRAGKRLRFYAYGAGIGQSAVEREMPDGQCHGAFTYALLKGLEGASTGSSDNLHDYLCNAMRTFVGEENLRIPTIAQEPTFGPRDAMQFGSQGAKSKFPLTLSFPPACVGQSVLVKSGSAPEPVATVAALPTAQWPLELEAGTYYVSAPAAGIIYPFTVIGGGIDGVFTVS